MQSKSQAQAIQADLVDSMRTPADRLAKIPEWRFVYTDGMKKLNAFVKEIKRWLSEKKRLLYIHF